MKFMLALLVVSGTAFAYTSSPAGNERVKDPAWTTGSEKRDPASVEVKSPKQDKPVEKKMPEPKL